ncbi:MAG: ABC transporter ATP-binding protein [Gammaproteobacteria bacterium]|nr:ABC transporter ATP-binding protein [Gammaproteobacteria bacterium]MYF38186.1 ABC transporter ATP-binding protein [Gammaproteobacteria bacterium]
MFEVSGLSKHFGGVAAVDDVSFSVNEGETFSIMGPNGAGKTTVLNLISRFYDVDEGTVQFGGQDITRVRPHDIARVGIARTFQNIELFERETVLQNLLIAQYIHRQTNIFFDVLFLPRVRRQEVASRKVLEDIIDLLHLQRYREQYIHALPFGVRKLVELARALCLKPKLLLLDEPSSGLNPEETEDLSFWIEDINKELGITILMVEHDMNLIGQVSDRVLVLASGRCIALGTPTEVKDHPDVIAAYLGT